MGQKPIDVEFRAVGKKASAWYAEPYLIADVLPVLFGLAFVVYLFS